VTDAIMLDALEDISEADDEAASAADEVADIIEEVADSELIEAIELAEDAEDMSDAAALEDPPELPPAAWILQISVVTPWIVAMSEAGHALAIHGTADLVISFLAEPHWQA